MTPEINPQLTPPKDCCPSGPVNPLPMAQVLPVAGFWLRCSALILDVALLSILAGTLLVAFSESLYAYRTFVEIFGLMVTVGYFMAGSSSKTGGQTLAKKLFKIRTVSLDGNPLTPRQAIIRGLLVNLLPFTYFYIRGYITGPSADFTWFLVIATLHMASLTFFLTTVIYCGLHPKKRSLHDWLAGTAVIRISREEDAQKFLDDWQKMDYSRAKTAKWFSWMVAGSVVLGIGWVINMQMPEVREQLQMNSEANQAINQPLMRLGSMAGPSEEAFLNFQAKVAEYNRQRAQWEADVAQGNTPKGKPLEALTTESLVRYYTGREFFLGFDLSESMTSETLCADYRYLDLLDSLPYIAEDLSVQYFADEDGVSAPYTGIKVAFSTTVSAYASIRRTIIWNTFIPVTGHEPEHPLDLASTITLKVAPTEQTLTTQPVD